MTSLTPPFHSSSLQSPSSSVPAFHSLGNGTVEQEQILRNTQWKTAGTSSLKAWQTRFWRGTKTGTNLEQRP